MTHSSFPVFARKGFVGWVIPPESKGLDRWNFLGKMHEEIQTKTSRYTEPQILAILRQTEGGMPVAELCQAHGMMLLPRNGLSSNHERERVVLQMAGVVLRDGCLDDRPDQGA